MPFSEWSWLFRHSNFANNILFESQLIEQALLLKPVNSNSKWMCSFAGCLSTCLQWRSNNNQCLLCPIFSYLTNDGILADPVSNCCKAPVLIPCIMLCWLCCVPCSAFCVLNCSKSIVSWAELPPPRNQNHAKVKYQTQALLRRQTDCQRARRLLPTPDTRPNSRFIFETGFFFVLWQVIPSCSFISLSSRCVELHFLCP